MEFRHFHTYRLPRGRRYEPPFAQAAVAATVWTPDFTSSHRRAAAVRARRGVVRPVPPAQAQSVAVAARRRPAPARARRGHFFEPGWGVSYDPNPPFAPQSFRPRVKPALLRRGHSWEPGWPPAAQAQPPAVPDATRPRLRRPVAIRRGRRWDVVPAQAAVPPPVGHRAVRAPVTRRSTVRALVVPAQAPALASPPQPRRRGLLARRGKRFEPGWTTTPITAPDFPPQTLRARVKAYRLARGHSWEPGWPQAQAAIAPPFPPQSLRARAKVALLRRGHSFEPGWPQSVDAPVDAPHGLTPAPRPSSGSGGLKLVAVPERSVDRASSPALTTWRGLPGVLRITPVAAAAPTPAVRRPVAPVFPLVLEGADGLLPISTGLPATLRLVIAASDAVGVLTGGEPGALGLERGTDEPLPPALLRLLFDFD